MPAQSMKMAGWGILAAIAYAWTVAAMWRPTGECLVDCSISAAGAILLGTASASAAAGALWLLAGGYGFGAVSTPAAVAAKVGRIVARFPYLAAVASLYLMVYAGPIGALLVAVWNVGSAFALSESARRLERNARSDELSAEGLWTVAFAIVGAVALLLGFVVPMWRG